MKRRWGIFAAVVFLFSSLAAQETKVGKEITLKDKTPIDNILENPEEFVGQKVLVNGKVEEVCPMMGCWIVISDAASGNKIKVKVKDGEIVFPQEAVNGNALVEGEVYKIELDEEEAKKYYEHLAEEKGEEFDEASVTGPVTLYQIKGSGAELAFKNDDIKDETAE